MKVQIDDQTRGMGAVADRGDLRWHSDSISMPLLRSAGSGDLLNLHLAAIEYALATSITIRNNAFKYVLMLTATPIQNRLWDIYSLVDLLSTAKGHKNPLGNPRDFATYYLRDSAASARDLHSGRREKFRRRLAEYMVRHAGPVPTGRGGRVGFHPPSCDGHPGLLDQAAQTQSRRGLEP